MRKTFLKIFSAMTAALFLSCNLSAQEKETIELYKGEIPGSIGNPQAAPDGGGGLHLDAARQILLSL